MRDFELMQYCFHLLDVHDTAYLVRLPVSKQAPQPAVSPSKLPLQVLDIGTVVIGYCQDHRHLKKTSKLQHSSICKLRDAHNNAVQIHMAALLPLFQALAHVQGTHLLQCYC